MPALGNTGVFTFKNQRFASVTNKPPQEAWGLNNSRVTRYYKVPWQERHNAVKTLLGRVWSVGTGIGTYLHRETPHALTNQEAGDEYMIDLIRQSEPWLYATSVPSCVGAGNLRSITGTPVYEWAELQVIYEPLPYRVREDEEIMVGGLPPADEGLILADYGIEEARYISRQSKDATKILESRGFTWVWFDGPNAGKAVAQATPYVVPGQLLTYTWYQVPRAVVPFALYEDMHGWTNDAEFDDKQPETLMFVGYEEEPVRTVTGFRCCNIKITLRHYKQGVNFLPDPNDGNEFHEIGSNVSLLRPFEPTDYKALFRPAS